MSAFDDIYSSEPKRSIKSNQVCRPMTYTVAAHYALMPQRGMAPVTLHTAQRNCSLAHTPTASGGRQTTLYSLSAVSAAVTLANLAPLSRQERLHERLSAC